MRLFGLVFAVAILGMMGCKREGPQKPTYVAADNPSLSADKSLTVSSTSFPTDGPMPLALSSYGLSVPPNLTWSKPPAGTRSVLVLMEDPDAPGDKPFVHWLLIDISPTITQAPGDGSAGENSQGARGYYGPHPPDGPAHRYYFQVYALDKVLGKDVTTRDAAVAAMAGHVLAKGVLMGTFAKP